MNTIDLCIDCTLSLAGYDAHEQGRMIPLPVKEFVESVKPGEITNTGEVAHFSWAPCDGCKSTLGGERFEHEDHRLSDF